ncbi:D-2-hydroxyacid dehydrogenase family protein [Vineibacter terrae]|uniref:D-2-hydroxyacid dehydrogenase family protein n=1 Tax=Vineibacter terrae TaxID=2586908 RepID=A0A5C8PPI1_9HYPH|nr:D-2-hydroxyacid dehydrogenase family protein [Vineibacter terrae]TXL75930.1 D-2-hydroxyacid dehydrogenase family protein [Vineibacter terrae]
MPVTDPVKLAILDDYQKLALGYADWDKARARGVEITAFDHHLGTLDQAAAVLAPFDAVLLMRERQAMPKALIDRLPNLKFMILTGARAPSLDLAACTARGIPVSNTGTGPSQSSTSELAWTLLMDAARHVTRADRLVRAGGWHGGLEMGTILAGRRLGILGLGKLGAKMAHYAKAFDMEVVAWSQNLTPEKAREGGATLVSKDELLSTSDVITIHLVLSDRTRGLIGAPELARMKKGAVLVNSSRGPIVNEAALIEALRTRHLGAAGLDVYDIEPLPPGHPLTTLDNVVLTPHLGYVADSIFRTFYRDSLENLLAWLDGKPIRVINPEAMGKG